MTPFRQTIRAGQSGSDVLAVKRALVKMRVHGTESLVLSGEQGKFAGDVFVECLKATQRGHALKADGIYGPTTHAVVARHFDLYGVSLYRRARIRKPPVPPTPWADAPKLARRLLEHRQHGRYHADNPGDLYDLERTAAGKPVWTALGAYVHLHAQPLALLVWLIEDQHMRIGTFALASDHHRNDGPHGHVGGWAVDISSVDGVSIAGGGSRDETLKVVRAIHDGPHRPWQLIADGYAYTHDFTISALTIPSAGYYGYSTMRGHRDHVHAGYH